MTDTREERMAAAAAIADKVPDDVLQDAVRALVDGNKVQLVERTEGGWAMGLIGGTTVKDYVVPQGFTRTASADLAGSRLPAELQVSNIGINAMLDEAEARGLVTPIAEGHTKGSGREI